MSRKLKDYKCRQCGGDLFYAEPLDKNDNVAGLYCSYCGAWNKWLNKDEKRIMYLSRLIEIQDRFKLCKDLFCKDLQKECQQELIIMQFTDREVKEMIDIIGELVFIKKNEAMIAKIMSAGAYGKAVSDFKALGEAIKDGN